MYACVGSEKKQEKTESDIEGEEGMFIGELLFFLCVSLSPRAVVRMLCCMAIFSIPSSSSSVSPQSAPHPQGALQKPKASTLRAAPCMWPTTSSSGARLLLRARSETSRRSFSLFSLVSRCSSSHFWNEGPSSSDHWPQGLSLQKEKQKSRKRRTLTAATPTTSCGMLNALVLSFCVH